MSGRDKFLTETMGECWHEPHTYRIPEGTGSNHPSWTYGYCKCGKTLGFKKESSDNAMRHNRREHPFSTWGGFGKLWEWAQKQEWWGAFRRSLAVGFDQNLEAHIHPDRFADALYTFLKERSSE